MKKLSVVINTKNAAGSLSKTLESVRFADEIIVADMESTDTTNEIAKKFGARIVSIQDYGRVEPEARNEANLEAKGEWTLQVDADEVIPKKLQTNIRTLISEPTETMGFEIARKNIIFGEWIHHTGWWPDYQLRLFKTGSLRWLGGVHSKPSIDGLIEQLPASETVAIVHDNYRTVAEYIDRLNRYTTLQATETHDKKNSSYVQVVSSEFCRRYFQQEGWQDGQAGLLLSLLQSFYEVVAVAKRKELQGTIADQSQSLPEKDLRQLTSDIHYWLAEYHLVSDKSSFSKVYWRMRRKLRI